MKLENPIIISSQFLASSNVGVESGHHFSRFDLRMRTCLEMKKVDQKGKVETRENQFQKYFKLIIVILNNIRQY